MLGPCRTCPPAAYHAILRRYSSECTWELDAPTSKGHAKRASPTDSNSQYAGHDMKLLEEPANEFLHDSSPRCRELHQPQPRELPVGRQASELGRHGHVMRWLQTVCPANSPAQSHSLTRRPLPIRRMARSGPVPLAATTSTCTAPRNLST